MLLAGGGPDIIIPTPKLEVQEVSTKSATLVADPSATLNPNVAIKSDWTWLWIVLIIIAIIGAVTFYWKKIKKN